MYPRIGQKVECIYNGWELAPCEIRPELKVPYTIRAVREHPVSYPGLLFIQLREIVNVPCKCRFQTEEPSYDARAFRPLVDDEAKNEHVTEIINREKRKLEHEHERVRKREKAE